MKKILAIFSFFTLVNLNAQISGQVANMQMSAGGGNNDIVSYLTGDINARKAKTKVLEADIQGSAYTSDTFLPAQLFFRDEFQSNVLYRYNAYAEEIEIKDSNVEGVTVQGLARDKDIKLVTADGKSFSFTTFIDKKGLTQNGYLTKLADGKYNFYKRFDVKYTQGQKSPNSFVKATPPRFSKFTEYYLELDGRNRIDELELSNRKLLKLVDDSQKEALKVFLKENNIKLKREKDVYKVLAFLNQ